MQKRRLLTIFIIVFIDLLGFSLILPLIPFYAENYNATPFVVGLLIAAYPAMQFIGAPLLGRLSDRHGRRPVLLISILGTALGFLLLGLAEPVGQALAQLLPSALSSSNPVAALNWIILGVMFVSRMLDGLTGGNISVAQAYIADITTNENRAKGMGLIGAAFGLGFVIGPVVGGALTHWAGYAAPAFAAAMLASLNLVAVFIWLPESLTPERREAIAKAGKKALFSVRALWQALGLPRVGPLLQIRVVYGLAFATFETMFALYAQYHLNLSADITYYVFGYVGILVVLVQGVAIGRLTARYTETNLVFSGAVMMALSLFGWAVAPSLWVLLIVLIPLSLAAGILNTVINSLLSKAVYHEDVGGTMGLSSGLESLTRIFAPIVGGLLLGQIGSWAPGIFGALLMTLATVLVWQRLIVSPDPPLPARAQEESAPVRS